MLQHSGLNAGPISKTAVSISHFSHKDEGKESRLKENISKLAFNVIIF